MSPKHSIDFCPICGGGLCGIRICAGPLVKGHRTKTKTAGGDDDRRFAETGSTHPHGLIVCDECEAIWLEPDLSREHQYPDPEDAKCPICEDALWGEGSRWADVDDVESLGWAGAVNPDLDATTDEGIA